MNQDTFAEKVEAMSISQNRHIFRWDFKDIDEIRAGDVDPDVMEKSVLMVMANILIIAKRYAELPLIAVPHHRVTTDGTSFDHLDAAHRLLYAKRHKLAEYVPPAHVTWLEAFLDFPFYDAMRKEYGSEYGSLDEEQFREEVHPRFSVWNDRREEILNQARERAKGEHGEGPPLLA